MNRLRFTALLVVVGLLFSAPSACWAVLIIDDFTLTQIPSSSPDTKTVAAGDGLAAGAKRTLSGTVGETGLKVKGSQLVLLTTSETMGSMATLAYTDFPGGTLALGNNNILDLNGGLSLASNPVNWDLKVDFDSSFLTNSGTWNAGDELIMTAGTVFGNNVKAITIKFTWDDEAYVNLAGQYLTAVPEPSTLALSGFAALGLVGLAFRSRRKKG